MILKVKKVKVEFTLLNNDNYILNYTKQSKILKLKRYLYNFIGTLILNQKHE